ncbi:DUF4384 domain-containing protein [Candidatus Fermentibacteria bacterium]|nr:DUF4384 domain-containing protein [Candidatus Fermentibacteria bacterium]
MRTVTLGFLLVMAGTAFAVDFEGAREIIVEPVLPSLEVGVWTDRGERAVYYPGETIKLYFKVSRDAYLVVYDVDTEGRVKLLFPTDPYRGGWVSGRATHTLPPAEAQWDMSIAGPTGIEYVVVVASTEPFVWDEYTEQLAGGGVLETIVTDPQIGIERINQLIAPTYGGTPYYVSDRTSFYVERRVPYPRYMCYDCHSPRHWDPYYSICPAFEIVIYSRYDSYYYRPPYNPWGRRPYYWYKRKTNRDYPTVKRKNAPGREYWEGRSKRKWDYPTDVQPRDGKDGGDRQPHDPAPRWKEVTPPDRPAAPEIRVRNPPAKERAIEPRRSDPATPRGSEPPRDKPSSPEPTRDKPPSSEQERSIQTRPFYREKAETSERREQANARAESDAADSRRKEK